MEEEEEENVEVLSWKIQWESSVVVSHLIPFISSFLKEKTFLEIGCGLCASPSVAASKIKGCRVIASDISTQALSSVEKLQISSLETLCFDWESDIPSLNVDIICGSDILYDLTHVKLVSNVIYKNLSSKEGSFAIISDPLRYLSCVELFS